MTPAKPETIICPACEQGVVRPVRIEPCGIEGSVCAECEAFWETGDPIHAASFVQLSHVAQGYGLSLSQIQLIWKA